MHSTVKNSLKEKKKKNTNLKKKKKIKDSIVY